MNWLDEILARPMQLSEKRSEPENGRSDRGRIRADFLAHSIPSRRRLPDTDPACSSWTAPDGSFLPPARDPGSLLCRGRFTARRDRREIMGKGERVAANAFQTFLNLIDRASGTNPHNYIPHSFIL
jgi:hypothetical protein